jgi:hypothetical protein
MCSKGDFVPLTPRLLLDVAEHWAALVRYCDDGRLDIDNNAAERALRTVAVGRKNWVFFGDERGGKTAAVMYSLIPTC